MYEKITKNVSVRVKPSYLEEQSSPEDNHFVWAYHVRIENQGDETLTLHSRYWKIMDDRGSTQIVEGDGVVGEQPILNPGDVFEYTSGTPLTTASGIMVGSYFMKNVDGTDLQVEIPAFSLDSPYQIAVIH